MPLMLWVRCNIFDFQYTVAFIGDDAFAFYTIIL